MQKLTTLSGVSGYGLPQSMLKHSHSHSLSHDLYFFRYEKNIYIFRMRHGLPHLIQHRTTHMPYPRPRISLLMKYGMHCAQIAYTWCHRSLPFGQQQAVGLVCHWQRETVRNYLVLNPKTKANMTFTTQLKHYEWDKSFCSPHRIHTRAGKSSIRTFCMRFELEIHGVLILSGLIHA